MTASYEAQKNAWNAFWNTKTGSSRDILPAAPAIDNALTALWQTFAKGLPRKAKTLDLATGSGTVIRKMLQARNDLKPTGVDFVASLPSMPKQVKIIADVDIADLPIADRSFDAATSQFGIEYGDTSQAIGELDRVLKAHGSIAFIVHHPDGAILKHNLPRKEGLQWVIESESLIAKARRFLTSPLARQGTVPVQIASAAAKARSALGQSSVAVELATAIANVVAMTGRAPLQQILAALSDLEHHAVGEMGRICSLQSACANADPARICDELTHHGFERVTCGTITAPNDSVPYALHIQADRTIV